jgi:hypothetical protein
MNRDNSIDQLRDQTVVTQDKIIPAVGTGQSVTRHLIRWGDAAPTGTPDAEIYIRTATGTAKIYVNVSNSWTALTIN